MEDFWKEIAAKHDAMPPDKRNHNMVEYLALFAIDRLPWSTADTRKMYYESRLNGVIVRALRQNAYRRSNSELASTDDYSIAFIWDLDVITMLPGEFMEEISQEQPDVDLMRLNRLVERVVDKVDSVYPDEGVARNLRNIEDALQNQRYFSRRYIALKSLYNEIRYGEDDHDDSIINHALLEKCGMVGEEVELCHAASRFQEVQNQRWRNVKKSLKLVNTRSNESRVENFVNLVMSKEEISYSAAQILVSNNASEIAIENVYSSCEASPHIIWNTIRDRFGEYCRLVYITSNTNCKPDLPKKMGIQICPVNTDECIEYILNCQQEYLK